MKINGKKFITVSEMAKALSVTPNTIKQRLFVAGIKPITREALYDISALKAISKVPGKGRPKTKAAKKGVT